MAGPLASLLPLPSLERGARIAAAVLSLGRPWLSTTVSLMFMYTLFHVLAVIWAFLINAGVTVGLELSSFLLSGQSLLELDQQKAFATFYFFYGTFRSFTKFGAVVAAVAWESFDDKQARRVVNILYERGDFVLPLLLLPQGLVALVVLAAPRVCNADEMARSELTEDCSEFNSLDIICQFSPVAMFTDGHVLIRRITQHALVIGLVQVILIFATLFPNWQDKVMHCRRGSGIAAAVFLNSTLGVLWLLTFLYFLRWAALHLCIDVMKIGLLSDEKTLQDIGLALTVFWNSWFFLLSCFLGRTSGKRASAEDLRALFHSLKVCLIAMIAGYFWRGCGHPNIGFLEAQQELTGLTIILPTFYALGYVFALFLDRMTYRLTLGIIATTLLALYALESVGQVEWRKAPGLVLCAFVHIMTKLTQYFGKRDENIGMRAVSSLSELLEDPTEYQTVKSGEVREARGLRLKAKVKKRLESGTEEFSGTTGSLDALPEAQLDVQDIRAARKLGVGLAMCAGGIAFVFGMFILFTASIAILQDEFKFFPETIRYNIEKGNSSGAEYLHIDHAKLAGLTLVKGSAAGEGFGDEVPETSRGYATCGVKYFGIPLDAVDYALLSEVAYFDRKEDATDILNFALADSPATKEFTVKLPDGKVPAYKLSKVPRFFEVQFPKLNLSVITVRGTDIGRMGDVLEDIKLYTEPVVMQLISMVFPTVRFLSDHTIALIIDWYSCALRYFGLESKATYADHLQQYLQSVSSQRILLTGHSLGGGIARLVALREGLPSVTFSPPGIKQSYRKHESLFSPQLHDFSVTILAEHDIISRIDSQVGLQQYISCQASGQALLLSCHMLEGTICELVNRCGDKRFSSCEFKFSLASVAQYVWLRIRPKQRSIATYCITVLLMICAFLILFVPRDFA